MRYCIPSNRYYPNTSGAQRLSLNGPIARTSPVYYWYGAVRTHTPFETFPENQREYD